MPKFDIDVHVTQNRSFRARAWQEPAATEVVPHMKVELIPYVGLT
jgi:hypothetical protein